MQLFSIRAAAAALVLLASAGAASAQDVDVSANVAVTSDYVFRGFSQTDESPALQGGVDVTVGNFYGGVWASNVDFGDNTDAEIDVYGGLRWEAVGTAFDVGVITYLYAPGANGDLDYIEIKAAASRAVGPVTAGVAGYYSPDFFGVDEGAFYGEVNAAVTPVDKVTVSGALGKQWLNVSDDYTTWNIGAAYAFTDNLALDVRYHGTDVDDVELADDRIVGTIKVLF